MATVMKGRMRIRRRLLILFFALITDISILHLGRLLSSTKELWLILHLRRYTACTYSTIGLILNSRLMILPCKLLD